MQSAPPDTETIRARLAAMLPELRERYGVQSLALFGSYARGEQTLGSDIDLVVDFDELPDLYAFVGLGLDLEEALGMKVDVATRDMLKKRVAETALRDLVPV
jgi:uncharacterized protein